MMARSHCLLIFVLGAVLPAGVLSNVIITLDPTTLTLTPDQADNGEGHVNVTCQASLLNENRTELSQLSIMYVDRSKSTIVRAAKIHHNGIAELMPSKRVRVAEVSGNVTEGRISLRLKRASCEDSGRYTCTAYYATQSQRPYVQRSQRLAISVSPGPLFPTQSPRATDSFIQDDVLTMTCQGPLGTLSSQQQHQWVWEYQDKRDSQASDSAWQPYDGAPSDVVSGPLDTHNKCYARGSSTLTRRLTQADSNRQYRCYVRIGRDSFAQFAAGFLVGTVQSSSSLLGTSARLTPQTLTLTPDQADKGEGHVDVTCQSPPVNQTGSPLWQLSIVYVNGSQSTMVKATKRSSANGTAELDTRFSRKPGAAVSGSVSEGQISLHLNQASCEDSGGYLCRATYASPLGKQPTPTTNIQHLNITVAPGQLTATQSPTERGWRLDDVITMTCEGPLGTVSLLQQPEWVWEYQNTRAHTPVWQPYDGAPSDVVSGPLDTHHKCYARGSSTLTRRLVQTDSDRQYRCYVRIGGDSFAKFAATFIVGTVQASEPHLHNSLFLGLGVGGCVGMTVGVVGVVAAGIFVWFWGRRRRLMRKQSVNCPLLPTHRDPGWYGEYLEPIVRVPQQEQEDQCSALYSEIPDDIALAKKNSLSATSRK